MIRRMQRGLALYGRLKVRFSSSSSSSSLLDSSSACVTRKNFESAVKQLKDLLPRADFVAVDMEMSGMHSAPWRRSMELDTVSTRYQNLKDSAESFSLLQCGLCLFRYDSSREKFIAHPYNFFLFPRNQLSVERDYLCQTSSLEFLAKHRFDFNACIYEGISYLSMQEEEKARAQLAKNAEEENAVPKLAVNKTADVMFSERVRLEVGLWRASKIMAKHKKIAAGEDVPTTPFPALLVNIADKRQAKLVVQVVGRNFDDLFPVVGDGDEVTQVKVLYTGSAQRKTELQADLGRERAKLMEDELVEAVGFRHVIDALIASKKPIVGHNCILDFAHIHSKFIGPLPDFYSAFCSTIHKHFPAIIDTKYMLKAQIVKEVGISVTALNPVYTYFFGAPKKGSKSKAFPKVTVEVADGFYNYTDSDLKHEAGFDAYMTGAVFAQMWRLVCASNSELRSLAEKISHKTPGVADFANLLYLGWAGHYVLDLVTGEEAQGKKALPERVSDLPYPSPSTAALLVSSQTSVGSSQQLKELVRSCFDGTNFIAVVEAIQIDASAAFLVFQNLRSMREFYHVYESIKDSPDRLSPMAKKIAASGLKVTRFETFESLCKSPLTTRKLADAIEVLKAGDQLAAPAFTAEEGDEVREEHLQAATILG